MIECSRSLLLSYVINAHMDHNSTGETPAGVRANPFTEKLCYQTASIYLNFGFFLTLCYKFVGGHVRGVVLQRFQSSYGQ